MDVKRFFLYAILVAALALAGCSSNGNGGMAGGMMPGGGNGDDMVDLETLMCTGDASDYFYKDNCMDPNPPPAPTDADIAMAKKIVAAIIDPDGDRTPNENQLPTVLNDGLIANRVAGEGLHNASRPGKPATLGDAGAPLYNSLALTAGGIGSTPPSFSMAGDTPGVDDAGVTLTNEFEEMMPSGDMTGDGMNMMDPFTRKVYTRTNEVNSMDVMDTITVYDNIEAGQSVTWSEYYATVRHGLNNPADAEGVLSVGNGSNSPKTEEQSALFEAVRFPSAPVGGTLTVTYEDEDPDTDGTQVMFEGTFNGVLGTFACEPLGSVTDNVCEATSEDGRLTSLLTSGTSSGWTFKPKDVESEIPGIMRQDDDYLAFGFWVKQTGTGADATYGIGTFSRGSMEFDDDGTTNNANMAIAALMGTATYRGMAAGQFAMTEDRADDFEGTVATGVAGEFMADVRLNARFGADTLDLNDFTIDGMVENFMDADGDMIGDDWSLKLDRATFATHETGLEPDGRTAIVTDITQHRHFFNGATTGMKGTTASDTMGKWTGMFYGPTVMDDTTTTGVNEAASGYPTGVAGEFIGYFPDGHVLGAFGAEKME